MPDATPQQIKKAYYNCVKSCHLDLSGNDPDVTNFCMFMNKVYLITPSVVRSILGPQYENSFVHLPAMGTRGGILIAVLESVCSLDHPVLTQNTLTATVLDHRNNSSWSLAYVYG
jgi:hypothetical protein